MRSQIRQSLVLAGSITVVMACGASVRGTLASPEIRLRDYSPLFVALRTGSGNLAVTAGKLAGVTSASLSDGDAQALRALESLRFELMALGFTLSPDSTHAAAIVEFSIGSIRYDPLAGWIADQALASFRDTKTGETLAFYRADSQAITPTVGKLVRGLTSAIRDHY